MFCIYKGNVVLICGKSLFFLPIEDNAKVTFITLPPDIGFTNVFVWNDKLLAVDHLDRIHRVRRNQTAFNIKLLTHWELSDEEILTNAKKYTLFTKNLLIGLRIIDEIETGTGTELVVKTKVFGDQIVDWIPLCLKGKLIIQQNKFNQKIHAYNWISKRIVWQINCGSAVVSTRINNRLLFLHLYTGKISVIKILNGKLLDRLLPIDWTRKLNLPQFYFERCYINPRTPETQEALAQPNSVVSEDDVQSDSIDAQLDDPSRLSNSSDISEDDFQNDSLDAQLDDPSRFSNSSVVSEDDVQMEVPDAQLDDPSRLNNSSFYVSVTNRFGMLVDEVESDELANLRKYYLLIEPFCFKLQGHTLHVFQMKRIFC